MPVQMLPARETWQMDNGRLLTAVHGRIHCKAPCPLHRPSHHSMRALPLMYDGEGRRFYRECGHDLQHPDPDSRNWDDYDCDCTCNCCDAGTAPEVPGWWLEKCVVDPNLREPQRLRGYSSIAKAPKAPKAPEAPEVNIAYVRPGDRVLTGPDGIWGVPDTALTWYTVDRIMGKSFLTVTAKEGELNSDGETAVEANGGNFWYVSARQLQGTMVGEHADPVKANEADSAPKTGPTSGKKNWWDEEG